MTTPSDQTPEGVAEETQPAQTIYGNCNGRQCGNLTAIDATIADLQSRLTAAEERERKLVEALRKLEEELREFARCEEDTRDCVEVDLHWTFARIADIATNALLAGSKG